MSYKAVKRWRIQCTEILAALGLKDTDSANKWLKEFEEENNSELELGMEFNIVYLKKLHGKFKEHIDNYKTETSLKKKAAHISLILNHLNELKNMGDVRDEIIKYTIHPIMKSFGFRKQGRSFIKGKRDKWVKLLVYSFRTNDYYKVGFRFEIESKNGSYPTDYRYGLDENTNIEEVKAEIEAALKGPIKTILDKY